VTEIRVARTGYFRSPIRAARMGERGQDAVCSQYPGKRGTSRRPISPSGVLHFSAMRSSTLAQMRYLAKQRGGKCISRRYISSRIPLRWKCRRGHEWEVAPGLVKGGRWCPHCAHVARLSLNAMVAIATSRGGRCLSAEDVNVETPLSWKCEAGHQWAATPASIRSGSWCPSCQSTRYINNRHPLLWECKRRHRWK
jgi:hypothetical protein